MATCGAVFWIAILFIIGMRNNWIEDEEYPIKVFHNLRSWLRGEDKFE